MFLVEPVLPSELECSFPGEKGVLENTRNMRSRMWSLEIIRFIAKTLTSFLLKKNTLSKIKFILNLKIMKCPVCSEANLVMTERSGVEIDYCPTCRGVWLDRGELDKIIERSQPTQVEQYENPKNERNDERNSRRYHDDDDDDDDYRGGRWRRRESIFSELFDF